MTHWSIPAGSTFGLGRKYIRQMFTDIYIGDIWTSLTKSLKIGTEATDDYLEIETDGTLVNVGEGTTWDDIAGSLIARRLQSATGTLKYNYEENSITMERSGNIDSTADRLIFNFQYPHAAVEGGLMKLHIHWEQTSGSAREFTVQYRVQDNGLSKTTAWTEVIVSTDTNNIFPYTSGTLNQITTLADVDLDEHSLSATVQFRVARTDSNAGDIEATFVDAHVERDMNGSREEYSK